MGVAMVPPRGKTMTMNENRQIAAAQADGEAADDRRRLAMTVDQNKLSCGCDFPRGGAGFCDCKLEPFTAMRADLRMLNRGDLFTLYTRCLSDEMSPVMWRGFTKADILEMFLDGGDSVELTPFI